VPTKLVFFDHVILAGEVQVFLAHPKHPVPGDVACLGELVAVEVEVANVVPSNVAVWGDVLALAVEK